MVEVDAFVDNFLWSVKYYLIVLVLLSVSMVFCIKFTVWGKQFLNLNKHIIFRRAGILWWTYALLTVYLAVLTAQLSVTVNVIFGNAVNFLQLGQSAKFWLRACTGLCMALVDGCLILLLAFLQQRLSLYWRALLTEQIQTLWLKDNNSFLFRFLKNPIDNPDQRIDLDTSDFSDKAVSLPLKNIPSVIIFMESVSIVWHYSFSLKIGSVTIYKTLFLYCVFYIVITTVLTFLLGKPLRKLNFNQKKYEANFRFSLAQLRINSKEIALNNTTQKHYGRLQIEFSMVYRNALHIIGRNLGLGMVNKVFTDSQILITYLIQAPGVLRHIIGLGDVMVSGVAGARALIFLNGIQQSYSDFTDYRAALMRLDQFRDACVELEELTLLKPDTISSGVICNDLTVESPDSTVLISKLDFALSPGDAMLISGESGAGKSTLILALAGLWPYSDGYIGLPPWEQCMFIPQQWYLLPGSLRSIIVPEFSSLESISDSVIHHILTELGLSELHDLDTEQDWSAILSPGQAQRISIARAILARPKALFLDESTSALNEQLEEKVYRLLLDELSDSVIISIGHRSTLRQFHNKFLTISRENQDHCISENPPMLLQ